MSYLRSTTVTPDYAGTAFMKIVYDGNIFAIQPAGGINRYFANIIRRLPNEVTPVVTLRRSQRGDDLSHPNLETRLGALRLCPKPIRRWWLRRHFHRVLQSERADVFHPTYYSSLSGQDFREYRMPLVVTVYDMIHERFAEQLDPRGELADLKRRAVQHAQAVICISNQTKEDLLNFCPIPEGRISVIPLASEMDEFADQVDDAPQSKYPYFLFVGSRAAHKNFQGLLAAFERVVQRVPEARLHLVGAPLHRRERGELVNRKLSDAVVSHGYVSDPRLASLYRHSVALVYPSFYEGFGIPPLEAMWCRTVVVAANNSSIPEVVGDAAILFDPNSTEQLAEILLQLLSHPEQRKSWIDRGRQRATLFSWNRTAAETMDVYRRVAA